MNTQSQLYLWPTKALYLGGSLDTDLHHHHAAQIAMGLEQPIGLSTDNSGWFKARSFYIPPDTDHAIRSTGGNVAMLYIEKDTSEYQGLLNSFSVRGQSVSINLESNSVLKKLDALAKSGLDNNAALGIVSKIIPNNFNSIQDIIDPRIRMVLQHIEISQGDAITLGSLSSTVNLSDSRLSHLFRSETGIAIRSYVVWKRIRIAIQHIANDVSLMEAGIAAGFSDSSHFTRTFKKLFGLAPSLIFSQRKNVQIYIDTLPNDK